MVGGQLASNKEGLDIWAAGRKVMGEDEGRCCSGVPKKQLLMKQAGRGTAISS